MKTILYLLIGLAVLLAPLGSAQAAELLPIREGLRAGVLLYAAPSVQAMSGRLAMAAAEVRTARDPATVYFAFPAVWSRRWVREARFYLLARSGSYSGDVNLTLAVFDQAGALKRVISQQAVNLKTTPASTWTALKLPAQHAGRVVDNGEVLAWRMTMTGGAGGSLVVQPIFDVTVENHTQSFLPVLRK